MEPGFSQEFVFLSIFFHANFLCETWRHAAMRRAAMRPNAACVEGAAGISLPQVGVWGSSPRNFFTNVSSEKGILGQF